MDISSLQVRLVVLAAILTLTTSARFPNEVPQLETPTMASETPKAPLERVPPPEAFEGDGITLKNPLTFFLHGTSRGAFGPSKREPMDAEIDGRIPSTKPAFGFPDGNGGRACESKNAGAPKITAIAGDLTRGAEMGSSTVGKVDGFAVEVKKGDWKSKTVAFTLQFKEGTISFFGVMKSAPEAVSSVAVVGGTGKYATARGSAKLQTAPAAGQSMGEAVVRITVKLNSLR